MTVVAGGVPQRVGPYEVQGVLGQGGMGTVLRARHGELDVVRALKILTSRQSPTGVARFVREVAALAAVRHPNVVGIHDSGELNGLPWYAMDLIEGEPLDKILERGGALPLDRALTITIGICQGVEALHQAGVVHRDLKPQNIVITTDGRPVVLDLGLAIAPDRDQRLTKTGAMVGTPNYMAPEQLDAAPVSARTDVHALGLILFELVTGQVALTGGSVHDLMGKILSDARPRASEVVPDLPVALDRVLAHAMARDPAMRHASAAELAAELDELRASSGLLSGRVQRLRFLLLALTLALLALVALVVAAIAIRRAPPGTRPTPDPTPAASVASAAPGQPAPSAPRRLTLAEREAAADELRAVARVPDLRERRVQLLRWLSRWADHPDAARARTFVREVDRTTPRALLVHRDVSSAERTIGRFVDAEHIITIGKDQSVRSWRLQREADGTPGEWREVGRQPVLMIPVALFVRPDAALVLTGGLVHRLDPGTLVAAPQDLDLGGADDLVTVSRSPDGAWLIGVKNGRIPSASRVVLLSMKTGTRRELGAARSPAHDALFAGPDLVIVAYGDDPRVATDDPEQVVKAYGLKDGAERWSHTLRAGGSQLALDGAGHVAVATEGGQVLVGPVEGAAPWQELVADEVVHMAGYTALAHARPVDAVAFGPRGRLYSLAKDDPGEVRSWNVAVLKEAAPPLPCGDPADHGLDVSPDGAWVLVGTTQGRVEVWAAPPE